MLYKNMWSTEVGSTLWGMFKPGSDHDLYTCRIVPTKDILSGYRPTETWAQEKYMGIDKVEVDETFIEIGHLISMLLKGTVNHYWSVTSPIVMLSNPLLVELRNIVLTNPTKKVYHSMLGMANSQKSDEIKRARLAGGKGYRTASRTALFGAKLLKTWKFDYKVPESLVNLEVTEDQVDYYIDALTDAYENSPFPEKPNETPYREFLHKVRKLEEEGSHQVEGRGWFPL
jgi:predicted nucleotidyltransferase